MYVGFLYRIGIELITYPENRYPPFVLWETLKKIQVDNLTLRS